MSKIKSHPFVGKNYSQGYKGKNVLLLGENHYTHRNAGWECITNDVVNRVLYIKKDF